MSKDSNKKTQVNFYLDFELDSFIRDLKAYYKINSTTEIIRFLIARTHKEMLREKKELGLDLDLDKILE